MILDSIAAALSQLRDPRFLRIIGLGVLASLGLLIGLCFLIHWGVSWTLGDGVSLPFVGTVTWTRELLSWASVGLVFVMSVFLMVPIAQAVQSLFLDQVADAVEGTHYPHLPNARIVPLSESVVDGLRAFCVVIGVNILALVLYIVLPIAAPISFYALNGLLLGREYFQVAAMRRVPETQAKALRKKHFAAIWIMGIAMAIPLTVPIVNLFVPVIGAASFTHLYHKLKAE